MALDRVAPPSTAGNTSLSRTNAAIERRAQIFFRSIAEHDSYYHLGEPAAPVEANSVHHDRR